MSPDELSRLVTLEVEMRGFKATLDKMEINLEKVVTFTTEIRGGKKALYALWCVIGGVFVWVATSLPGWLGKS